jgi:hypothetical protein
MGYTHYFNQLKKVPDEQWKTLVEASQQAFWKCSISNPESDKKLKICDVFYQKVLKDPAKIEIFFQGNEYIAFNGSLKFKEGYEDFLLPKRPLPDKVHFCKTAHQRYDWLVVAVLILADNICPGCYEIDSDGYAEDWQPVLDWLNEGRNEKYVMPSQLESRDAEEVSNA